MTTSLDAAYEALRPKSYEAVYKLLGQVPEFNLEPWKTDREGKPIKPSDNVYRNSKWGFGGGEQPIVLCIWWRE